jgi:hypothetical protein
MQGTPAAKRILGRIVGRWTPVHREYIVWTSANSLLWAQKAPIVILFRATKFKPTSGAIA